MWQAYYVATVHSVTGLTEDAILWELPLARGMAYLHAALCREGAEMRWSGEQEQNETMQKAIALMKKRRN